MGLVTAIPNRVVLGPVLQSIPAWLWHIITNLIPVKLPWIFSEAPLKINRAPGNIQGNLDMYAITFTVHLSHVHLTQIHQAIRCIIVTSQDLYYEWPTGS